MIQKHGQLELSNLWIIISFKHFETVCQFITNINIDFPYDLSIPLLFTYLRKMKIYAHKKIYTKTHIVFFI